MNEILAHKSLPVKYIRLVKTYLLELKAMIQRGNTLSKECNVKNCMKQGAVLYGLLFNLLLDYVEP